MHVIQIPRGDSRIFKFQVRHPQGFMLPLTGFTITAQAKRTLLDTSPLWTASGAIQDPDTSALVLVPTAATTTPGKFHFSIVANKSGVEVYTLMAILEVLDHA